MRGLLLHLRNDPEDDDGANHCTDEFSNPSCNADAQQAEQPAAEHAADDAQEEVDEQTFACAALQFACDETGQDAGDDTNDESFHSLMFLEGS